MVSGLLWFNVFLHFNYISLKYVLSLIWTKSIELCGREGNNSLQKIIVLLSNTSQLWQCTKMHLLIEIWTFGSQIWPKPFWMYLPFKYRVGELVCVVSITICLQKIPDSVAILLTLGCFRWTCSAQISAKPLILSIPWGSSLAWNHICRRTLFGINTLAFPCCVA